MDCPKMLRHILGVTMDSVLPYGFLYSKMSDGGSVDSAKEAKVSIIKLTQSISIEFKGDSLRTVAPKKHINKATALTVS